MTMSSSKLICTILTPVLLGILLTGCSLQKQLGKLAAKDLLETPELKNAHTGIAVYEPATGKSWFDYQGDKFFTPASNTKILTCYAAMKYLGDSLTGIIYAESASAIYLLPTGDPTLLHPDFPVQPVVRFLQQVRKPLVLISGSWQDQRWGTGWSWDDYNADYMPERSELPVYGNVIRFFQAQVPGPRGPETTVYTQPEFSWPVHFSTDTGNA